MEPLVSVIMTAYNSERYIGEAIESILGQTYDNLELIIVEDASTDHTLQVIKKYRNEKIKLLCNEKNEGTLYSMQRAMSIARGEYVAILDSDDVSFSERIEREVAFLQTHPNVLLCATKANDIINGKIEKREYLEMGTMQELRFLMLFYNPNLVHSTVMFRNEELKKRNIKYEKYSYCHDYYLLLKVAASGWIYRIDEVLGLYRIHSSQKTRVLPERKILREVLGARKDYARRLKGFTTTEKNVLCKAIEGRLGTYKEFKILEHTLKHYIQFCGFKNGNKAIIKRECTNLLLQQKKNNQWFFFCMTSGLIDKSKVLYYVCS